MPTYGICRASMGHQTVCFGATLEILHSEFSIHAFSSFPPLSTSAICAYIIYILFSWRILRLCILCIYTHTFAWKSVHSLLKFLNQFSSVIGGWSVDGLTTYHSNGSTVVNCSSQHLTSFAVLVNVAGTRVRVNRNSQFDFQNDSRIHV